MGVFCTARERGCALYCKGMWVCFVLQGNVGVLCIARERGCVLYCKGMWVCFVLQWYVGVFCTASGLVNLRPNEV